MDMIRKCKDFVKEMDMNNKDVQNYGGETSESVLNRLKDALYVSKTDPSQLISKYTTYHEFSQSNVITQDNFRKLADELINL